jgi:regulatory LuxR family protein
VRVSRWSAAHPRRLDLVVAAVLAALSVPAGAALAGFLGLVLSAGLLAPLAVRRHPIAVTATVAAVAVAQVALLPIPLPADVAVPLAVHTVAAHVPVRAVRLAVLAAAEAGAVSEILAAVGLGLTNSEIAARLFVAESTVKTHFAAVLRKLELRDRIQAVLVARRLG